MSDYVHRLYEKVCTKCNIVNNKHECNSSFLLDFYAFANNKQWSHYVLGLSVLRVV